MHPLMHFHLEMSDGTLRILTALIAVGIWTTSASDVYQIGIGIADCTGPAAGVNMMGYANPGQTTRGIHTRQWSRAFIIGQDENRFVFVSVEAAMISHGIKDEVVKRLRKKFTSIYTNSNICLSATHTHSGPGGFVEYVLYLITSLGFVRQTSEALIQGIVKSIERAHASIKPGHIDWTRGDLLNAGVNRSPTAYAQNPEAERARYPRDVDTEMTLLKFTDLNGKPLGILNWFPVHGTSMNNTNRLISSDNKGYASLLFEKRVNLGSLPGKGKFVAAFAQSNEGDVSPNVNGPRCLDSGLTCDAITSTCNGQSQLCVASGPGKTMKESTKIIGERQFSKAWSLFERPMTRLQGPVGYRQQFINMSDVVVEVDGKKVRTCKPAVGHSFAAGTTDGAGMFTFAQGTRVGQVKNGFWDYFTRYLQPSSIIQDICHQPKPILFNTGQMDFPYPWQPQIVDTQVLRIGTLLILAVPGEFTTMAGRRLVHEIRKMIGPKFQIVIAGLSNAYAGYVTTPEEYQVQRYEGASTLYGPQTLTAYINQYKNLVTSFTQRQTINPGPLPPDLSKKQVSLLPGIAFDSAPSGKKFGSVLIDVKPKYELGSRVIASFVCGHLRNSLQTESSFLTVDYLSKNRWIIIATDANWETEFHWHRSSTLLGRSACTVVWDIPKDAKPGRYRIRHFGFRRPLIGKDAIGYSGVTSIFTVVS